jgi:diadenosine tetraphosphate (Ap4A) HIT family hydrolase
MSNFTLHPQLEQDSVFVQDLPVSQLRLMNNSAVPWVILVPRVTDLREIHHLPHAQQHQVMDEMSMMGRRLEELYKPNKINIAALGNIVWQLHIHIVARFNTDPAWPAPIWGKLPPSPYALDALASRIKELT